MRESERGDTWEYKRVIRYVDFGVDPSGKRGDL